jgi:hypothetical protein
MWDRWIKCILPNLITLTTLVHGTLEENIQSKVFIMAGAG